MGMHLDKIIEPQKEREIFLIFSLMSGIILFFNLWTRSLENHDYLRYAEVAREMIRSGDWIVPRLNGEIYLHKPPLLFWLIALPSSIYGYVTPLLARIPSFFSAWLGSLLVFQWGKRIYGNSLSGFISGGILLSNYQYFFNARIAKTDMLLCFFILSSLYSFYLGYHEEPKKGPFLLASFIFIGLGVLTKGPFGLIPLPIIFGFLLKEKKLKILVYKEFIIGYFVLILIVFLWIIPFISRLGLERSLQLLEETEVLTRKAPFYFYFVEIWPQFAPWSLFLPILIFLLYKEKIFRLRVNFFLIWFILLFIILTIFQYRASRYLLGAIPPLALMTAGIWRKKFLFFLIPFSFIILVWHVVEIQWINKNMSRSPGLTLSTNLKPFLKEKKFFGYKLDPSTEEELNFYLDIYPCIPMIKRVEDFNNLANGEDRILILMPKEVYEEFPSNDLLSIRFIKEFPYKKGRLVLISN